MYLALFALAILTLGVGAYRIYASAVEELATVEATSFGDPLRIVPQSSDVNGVTIVVTPIDPYSDVDTLSFDVVLSTHVQELGGYDLAKLARLVDGEGRILAPISWSPDATEGHHIGGRLQFSRPVTSSILLTIEADGERSFRWKL